MLFEGLQPRGVRNAAFYLRCKYHAGGLGVVHRFGVHGKQHHKMPETALFARSEDVENVHLMSAGLQFLRKLNPNLTQIQKCHSHYSIPMREFPSTLQLQLLMDSSISIHEMVAE